jgi:hypothetical protein
MTLIEAVQIAQALGIFGGGVGLLKWGVSVELRLQKLQSKNDN